MRANKVQIKCKDAGAKSKRYTLKKELKKVRDPYKKIHK